MPDYSKAKIYKLVSNQTDDIYYGSTTQPLHKRLYEHKSKYHSWLNETYHYTTAMKITKYDDVQIILVKEYPCENKYQLERKERKYIEKYECVNKYKPTRTHKEYYNENKQDISEKNKVYRKEHAEHISENKKVYYQKNKIKLTDYHRKWYEQNKDKVAEYRKEKFVCECGGTYSGKGKRNRHEASDLHKKHQKNIK